MAQLTLRQAQLRVPSDLRDAASWTPRPSTAESGLRARLAALADEAIVVTTTPTTTEAETESAATETPEPAEGDPNG